MAESGRIATHTINGGIENAGTRFAASILIELTILLRKLNLNMVQSNKVKRLPTHFPYC